MHAVIIVGGGPTGMMLAAELALARVDVAVVERRPTSELIGSRAGGLHSRTIELFDQRGIADRFLAEGKPVQVLQFAGASLDLSDFPTRYPYSLGLWQKHIERILAGWLAELPVKFYRGREVTRLAQDESGVDVTLDDGSHLRASYLVGCDGGRSFVRKSAGIGFPGWDATRSNIIAEVELAETPPEWGIRRDALGIHSLGLLEDGKTARVLVTEPTLDGKGEATLEDLRRALIAAYGSDFGVRNPTSLSRFTDMTRQASSYRDRRIFVAGDAAHVHAPDGGQGLNLGIGDAVNLGWKLAEVVNGTSESSLLDTYHAERHPVGARVLRHTMALSAFRVSNDRMDALRDMAAEVVALEEPRKRLAADLSGLGIRYDLGEGHPLLGRRMPDLDLKTGRVYELLHKAKPVLLELAGQYEGEWNLPGVGKVPPPTSVLIRPDGYVAKVGY